MLTSVNQSKNNFKVLTFDPMLERKYKNIIYLIASTIIATIGVQVYWNLRIYEVNKQQLYNQVQVSFDKAVESYFNEIAKEDVFTFIDSSSSITKDREVIIRNVNDPGLWTESSKDSFPKMSHGEFIKKRSGFSDSIIIRKSDSFDLRHISVIKGEFDSVKLRNLTSKIIFSFKRNHIELDEINTFFLNDLKSKNIDIRYGFKFTRKAPISKEFPSKEFQLDIEEFQLDNFPKEFETGFSVSSFLPHKSKLQLLYTDATATILKRMLGSIFLSFLLSIVIIGCLLFLLKVIFKQKQLSEIKNDFISNITHEFKTPIATIAVALEGFEKFDVLQDEGKRNKYLSMSNEQLEKLNVMVEKLLETATINADQYELGFKPINLSKLIKNVIDKHQFSDTKKTISLLIDDNIVLNLDAFHFENALNNVIDNAIKYGGNQIKISTTSKKDSLEIYVEDNGIGIDEKYKSKIFDQFYRVPTGNVHDVKGFGIGLYYTKNIIENHGGHISISENKNGKVVFKIVLPNE